MANLCPELHHLLRRLPRLRFPFDVKVLPRNGIYALFEKGEYAHGGDRVVRIGTHTGEGQLPSRLTQHFVQENKDRSIFRKNIGRALLRRDADPFIKQWELDLTTRKAKDLHAGTVDLDKQRSVEKKVTAYMQSSFSFVAFGVDEPRERLAIESACLSTLSLCSECGPSSTWLGGQSNKERIRATGLWNVNELFKVPLSEMQIEILRRCVGTAETPSSDNNHPGPLK